MGASYGLVRAPLRVGTESPGSRRQALPPNFGILNSGLGNTHYSYLNETYPNCTLASYMNRIALLWCSK